MATIFTLCFLLGCMESANALRLNVSDASNIQSVLNRVTEDNFLEKVKEGNLEMTVKRIWDNNVQYFTSLRKSHVNSDLVQGLIEMVQSQQKRIRNAAELPILLYSSGKLSDANKSLLKTNLSKKSANLHDIEYLIKSFEGANLQKSLARYESDIILDTEEVERLRKEFNTLKTKQNDDDNSMKEDWLQQKLLAEQTGNMHMIMLTMVSDIEIGKNVEKLKGKLKEIDTNVYADHLTLIEALSVVAKHHIDKEAKEFEEIMKQTLKPEDKEETSFDQPRGFCFALHMMFRTVLAHIIKNQNNSTARDMFEKMEKGTNEMIIKLRTSSLDTVGDGVKLKQLLDDLIAYAKTNTNVDM